MTVRVLLATTSEAESALRAALHRDGELAVLERVNVDARPPAVGGDVLVVDLSTLDEAGHRLILAVMDAAPVPVVALCRDADPTDGPRALAAGAVEAVSASAALAGDGGRLRRSVALVSGVRVVRRSTSTGTGRRPSSRPGIVAIAASTGGPAALAAVLPALRGVPAAVLLVQHLHGDFMGGFVAWLDNVSALPVSEAHQSETPQAAHVYVGPAGQHLRLDAAGKLALSQRPAGLHRPSADELLGSVAVAAGPSGVGVVLTGMGRDGATGLLAMRRAGARTFVQDEASCVVFGMPRAALELGAVEGTTPLKDLGPAILTAISGGSP